MRSETAILLLALIFWVFVIAPATHIIFQMGQFLPIFFSIFSNALYFTAAAFFWYIIKDEW